MKTLLSILLTTTVATSLLGQWELTTPIKTRSEFPGIHMMTDLVGYAIDRPLGAILRTDDGGSHWTRPANNISSQPRALFLWDDLRGIVVAGGGTVIRTTDGFNTTSTSLNPTFGNLSCVYFVNDTLGWIGTETGKIYRSMDAGATWALMASGQPTSNYFTSIQFIDTQTGYASCYAGEMLKSTDGGLTWQGVGPFDQLVLIQDIHFYTTQLGVGVGSAGEVIRTTDGGATWDSIPSNTGYTMRDLAVHGNTMVACGDWGRTIRSTDAGLTWTEIQVGSTDHQSLSLTPSGLGMLGTDGRIQRTTDFGSTWAVLVEGTWHTLINKMSFANTDTGVAVGWQSTGGLESGLLRTIDGGHHWQKAGSGGLGVHLAADGVGCRGGSSGAFARTTDHFATSTPASGPSVAIRSTWSFDANTHIVAGGYVNGGMYRTTNAGGAWAYSSVGNLSIFDLYFPTDLIGFAVGEGGIGYRTIDGGVSWQPMVTPVANDQHTVFFLDELNGWMGGVSSGARTTDGGTTWLSMNGIPSNTRSIFFTDMDTGYCISQSAQTLRSVDGGITWQNLLPPITNTTVGDAAWVDGAIVIGCNAGDIFRAQVTCPQTAVIPVITEAGGAICTYTTGTVQWYLNNAPLPNGTTPCISASAAGNYHVIVTDVLGCVSAPSVIVQVISTGVEEVRSHRPLLLSPNPAQHVVRLERMNKEVAVLSFIDAQGRTVLEQRIVGMTNTLDVSALETGVYLLRVVDAHGTEVVRLVKE